MAKHDIKSAAQDEIASAPVTGNTVRTTISMSRMISKLAAMRVDAAGFNSASDYFCELVRRDAEQGTVGHKLSRNEWENLRRAA